MSLPNMSAVYLILQPKELAQNAIEKATVSIENPRKKEIDLQAQSISAHEFSL